MSDDSSRSVREGVEDGQLVPKPSESAQSGEGITTDENRPQRRQFIAGVVTALGGVGGAALLGHQKVTAETDPVQLRSQIVSRIQEELKRSKMDLSNNYDRPDTPAGTHGRYLKTV